jgi:hypothetical protein
LFFPFKRVLETKGILEKIIKISFFSLAIFSSLHSAMRLQLTPVFYALGCANWQFITNNKIDE